MNVTTEKIIEEAMKMPIKERATIAERLLATLDEKVDKDVEIAWQKEVQHRANQIKSGEIVCLPWEEVRQKLRVNSSAKS